ncbi:MAG TPA: hypothetical protein DCE43_06690, partial [Planctomycetaceae bacterium]|nr:hypothetical protein [Planctomycetaceae bacterium]
MRVLLAVLLVGVVGVVGCGGEDSPGEGAVPTLEGSQATVDKSPAEVDPVVTLEKLRAGSKRNEQGEVVEVQLRGTGGTDASLLHLKGLTQLQDLNLFGTKITDAGLVHLKGLTKLQTLRLSYQITAAGVADLQ